MNPFALTRWNSELRAKMPREIVRWALAQAGGRAGCCQNRRVPSLTRP